MIPILVTLGLTLHAPVPKDKSEAEALRTLRGDWVVIGSEEFGRIGTLHIGDVFTFDDDRLIHARCEKTLEYKIRLSPKADPSGMDWKPAEPKDAAWSHRGIYKLDGEKLTICVIARFDADDAKDRPTKFRTKAEREKGGADGSVLIILERKRK